METALKWISVIVSSWFPAYLQGMETLLAAYIEYLALTFPAYLQGMETRNRRRNRRCGPGVPSLPTRNGNRWYILG